MPRARLVGLVEFGGGDRSMDFRVDSGERASFRDAKGEPVNETRYFEIATGERIVMACSMAMNGRIHTVSLATVTLADQGGVTRLTFTEQMCVIPPSDGTDGRRHGWTELLASLEAFLSEDGRRARVAAWRSSRAPPVPPAAPPGAAGCS
ncbi:MAG TPA: SRPBCC domain-containing protein [Rhizobiaceae bacterium]